MRVEGVRGSVLRGFGSMCVGRDKSSLTGSPADTRHPSRILFKALPSAKFLSSVFSRVNNLTSSARSHSTQFALQTAN